MAPKDYRPRLTIDITYEQKQRLGDLIPWGVQNKLFAFIVDDIIALLEKHGTLAIAAVLNGQLTTTDFSPTLKGVTNGDYQRPKSVDQPT